jgi:hypothetical protein
MESKEYDLIIIRQSTNCQNGDPLYHDGDIQQGLTANFFGFFFGYRGFESFRELNPLED